MMFWFFGRQANVSISVQLCLGLFRDDQRSSTKFRSYQIFLLCLGRFHKCWTSVSLFKRRNAIVNKFWNVMKKFASKVESIWILLDYHWSTMLVDPPWFVMLHLGRVSSNVNRQRQRVRDNIHLFVRRCATHPN